MGCACKDKKRRMDSNGNEQPANLLERLFLTLVVIFFVPFILVGTVFFVLTKYILSILLGKDMKLNIDWLYRLKDKYSKKTEESNEGE